jgi:hypothetical protein
VLVASIYYGIKLEILHWPFKNSWHCTSSSFFILISCTLTAMPLADISTNAATTHPHTPDIPLVLDNLLLPQFQMLLLVSLLLSIQFLLPGTPWLSFDTGHFLYNSSESLTFSFCPYYSLKISRTPLSTLACKEIIWSYLHASFF